MSDTQFPAMDFQRLGYDCVHNGQGQWNGVAILSRVGLTETFSGFADDDEPDPDSRIVWATCGGVRVHWSVRRMLPDRPFAVCKPSASDLLVRSPQPTGSSYRPCPTWAPRIPAPPHWPGSHALGPFFICFQQEDDVRICFFDLGQHAVIGAAKCGHRGRESIFAGL